MVKIGMLFLMAILCTHVIAQSDTLYCKESFEYYDSIQSNKLIVIWDIPPSVEECSQKDIVLLNDLVKEAGIEYIIVDMIIDSLGRPVCFRIAPKLEPDLRNILIEKLRLLRFTPALQKGKEVESTYTLKL